LKTQKIYTQKYAFITSIQQKSYEKNNSQNDLPINKEINFQRKKLSYSWISSI